jgi:hypothetical protein
MCGWQGALTCGGVCGCSGESALGAVEEATAEAEKHGDCSELLTALVAEAKGLIEEAKTEQAARARAAAEEAAAAAAVKAAAAKAAAAERLRLEDELAALMLRVQSDVLRMQQVRAQLGVPSPRLHVEETLCVVCFDAPKDHAIVPCMHVCACEVCAERLLQSPATCPVCREPIHRTTRVFF